MPSYYPIVGDASESDVHLSVRASNCLINAVGDRYFSPTDVAALTERQLLDTPNMGRVTVEEVKAWLADRGLSLAPGKPKRDLRAELLRRAEGMERKAAELRARADGGNLNRT